VFFSSGKKLKTQEAGGSGMSHYSLKVDHVERPSKSKKNEVVYELERSGESSGILSVG
jgi:hypothetical protein